MILQKIKINFYQIFDNKRWYNGQEREKKKERGRKYALIRQFLTQPNRPLSQLAGVNHVDQLPPFDSIRGPIISSSLR